ncbi:hypothetical protein IKE71_02430 [Candidatus Saccharibacteria bacterium]|nr:hypothetical protein [Candidatus Saccharibacteria bacterium]
MGKTRDAFSSVWLVTIELLIATFLAIIVLLVFIGIPLKAIELITSCIAALGAIVALLTLWYERKKTREAREYETSSRASAWIGVLELALAREKGKVVICNSSAVPI